MTGAAPSGAARSEPLAALEGLLGQGSLESPPISAAGAAVTIVLRPADRDLEVLLIERARNPRDPGSGQVALPGGQVAVGDRSLGATALRELEEEVGLSERDLRGPLRYLRTELARQFGVRVAIFAAEYAPSGRAPSAQSPSEVGAVFWLPRAAAERTEPIEVDTARGTARVEAAVFEGHVLWGFTRRVVREFFGLP